MLTRRHFLAGASCCMLPLASAFSGGDAQPVGTFVCGTLDSPPGFGSDPSLDQSSTDGAFDKLVLDTVIRDLKLTPFGVASLAHRWRRSDGNTPNTGVITLGVHFLNGIEDQKRVVRDAASLWLNGELGSKIRFAFDSLQSAAQITVNLEAAVNNSAVGRNSVEFATFMPTMHLADVSLPHVITHEFGHALGLQHEHSHPATSIQWNKPVVYADMERQGWTKEMVDNNIFAHADESAACIGDPGYNPQSIMLYPVPPHWTLDGWSSLNNTRISDGDRNCAVAIYRA